MKFIEVTIIRKGSTEEPTLFQSIFSCIGPITTEVIRYSQDDTFIITEENGENRILIPKSVNYTIEPCILKNVYVSNRSTLLHISTSSKTSEAKPKYSKFGDEKFVMFTASSDSMIEANKYITNRLKDAPSYKTRGIIPIIVPSIYNISMNTIGLDVLCVGCISECDKTGQYLISYDEKIIGTEINNFIHWYFTECMKECYYINF